MLTVSKLQEYCDRVKTALPAIKRSEVAVVKDDLAQFMQDHKKDMSILMLALLPEHGMGGAAGAAKWENICGFFFLIKTDYSALKGADYINLFADTQQVAKEFAELLLIDQADNYGCGMLAYLDAGSISASPIKALSGCNGYYVQFSMKTNP